MTTVTASPIADETNPLTRKIGYFLGPALFILTFLTAPPENMPENAWLVCGLAMWMASWWITEAMPLPVTSLLPIVIIPTFGITTLTETLQPYASPIIYLIFGGFVISLAMQKCDLHIRIGLGLLRVIGRCEKSVLASIMFTTAFMGMWISNTATTIMMLPMALSMAVLLSNVESDKPITNDYFAKALILGVVYSSVIGGIASLIGTPTNAILVSFMAEHYDREISVASWMAFGIPIALTLLVLTWVMLTVMFLGKADVKHNVREVMQEGYKELGPVKKAERAVMIIFGLTAGAWIFSPAIEASLGIHLADPAIAVVGALLLFLTPLSKKLDEFPLTWKDTSSLPWGILVFFGGSMSIAAALTGSGVTEWLSLQLNTLAGVNIVLIVLLVVLLLIGVSELMNNVATIIAFLPIMAAMATAMEIDPLIIMIPATLGASCAFMLPGASAANALAFGTGYLKINDMIKPGFILDLISTVVIIIGTFTVISWVYGY